MSFHFLIKVAILRKLILYKSESKMQSCRHPVSYRIEFYRNFEHTNIMYTNWGRRN